MSDSVEPTPDTISDEELEKVPLHFLVPTGLTSRYAQHMIIQASEFDVTLSFFEIKTPIAIGGIEIQRKALKDGVTAECVARVTIAKARFSEFVKAFTNVPLNTDKSST